MGGVYGQGEWDIFKKIYCLHSKFQKEHTVVCKNVGTSKSLQRISWLVNLLSLIVFFGQPFGFISFDYCQFPLINYQYAI